MQVVIETPDYLSDTKALGLTVDEHRTIVACITQTPDAGKQVTEALEFPSTLAASLAATLAVGRLGSNLVPTGPLTHAFFSKSSTQRNLRQA